jgi:maltose-binding protein MalE
MENFATINHILKQKMISNQLVHAAANNGKHQTLLYNEDERTPDNYRLKNKKNFKEQNTYQFHPCF